MSYFKRDKRAYVLLEDGTLFKGFNFGVEGTSTGEIVFTTGMTGYQEVLTDPSYYGQIVLQTYPLIGNYGIIPADFEGKCCVRGYVVREQCQTPSNFRCEETLDAFLKANNIPGIAGIDTRAVTRILREAGTMNAAICDEIPADLTPIETYAVTGVVEAVSCKESSVHPAEREERFRVSLLDYGAKRNIVRELQKRGCTVTVLPATTSAEEILAADPDGVTISRQPSPLPVIEPEPWLGFSTSGSSNDGPAMLVGSDDETAETAVGNAGDLTAHTTTGTATTTATTQGHRRLLPAGVDTTATGSGVGARHGTGGDVGA